MNIDEVKVQWVVLLSTIKQFKLLAFILPQK